MAPSMFSISVVITILFTLITWGLCRLLHPDQSLGFHLVGYCIGSLAVLWWNMEEEEERAEVTRSVVVVLQCTLVTRGLCMMLDSDHSYGLGWYVCLLLAFSIARSLLLWWRKHVRKKETKIKEQFQASQLQPRCK